VFDDRYEVVSKLGSGGMADVFLANDRLLGRQVALKVLSGRYAHDEQFVERFRREASSAAGLNHPNIVQIYDRGEAEGTYYIAMEYLEGRTLKDIILKYAPLSPDLVVSVSTQILEALKFAHRRDVIHRDIKPQNIVIDNEGRVKVTDFGIARAGNASTMTEAGSILGTAHYLSPEQAQGRPVEAASDLYSLGVVMYEMVTGKLPFDGDNPVSIAMQHVHEQPVPPRSINPAVPENLEAVILRALAKRPTERYITAQQMLEDLRLVQDGEPVSAPAAFMDEPTQVMTPEAVIAAQPTQVRRRSPEPQAPPAAYEEEPPRRRSAWPWILVIILILALAGGAYVILSTWDQPGADLATVPAVVGLSEAEAKSRIEGAGFKFERVGEQASADVDEGDVARQDPEEGTKLAKGQEVRVWISSGQGLVEVPDVVGLSEAEAGQKIGAAGLKVKRQEEVNEEKAVGTVLRQNPEGGQKVEAGATVTIVVVAPTNTVTVPRLLGSNKDVAVGLLDSMGLRSEVVMVDSTAPGDTVVDQNPAPGIEVQPDTKVILYVSNAPVITTVRVPAVAGLNLTVAQAKAKLALYGLKAKVTDMETPDYTPGLVILQDPEAGVEVERGSTVEIFVAVEPVTTTTTTEPPTTTTTTTTAPPPPS
jgi:serine/threonine-protein kinase